MKRLDVVSGAFRNIGYDEKQRHLEVEFHNGRRYRYEGVPKSVHHEFMNADSQGDYFHQNIKYDYKATPLGPLKESVDKDEEDLYH